jgi:hypothetical protein
LIVGAELSLEFLVCGGLDCHRTSMKRPAGRNQACENAWQAVGSLRC